MQERVSVVQLLHMLTRLHTSGQKDGASGICGVGRESRWHQRNHTLRRFEKTVALFYLVPCNLRANLNSYAYGQNIQLIVLMQESNLARSVCKKVTSLQFFTGEGKKEGCQKQIGVNLLASCRYEKGGV